MCAPVIPKAPKVEKLPVRAATLLPDNGDPGARMRASANRRLTTSAMIFSKGGKLGSPSVTGPIGASGF